MERSPAATPQISVVIPAYNRAMALERSIGSVRAQTYADWELIVADDASTDDTREVVRTMSARDARIRLVALETNGGAARARNEGVAAARGRLLAFLDSDDSWLPGKLAAQLDALQNAARPDHSLSAHAHHVDDALVPRTWPKRGPHPGEPLSEYMFIANGNFQTSTWMLSRTLALEFPFQPALRRHQDWDVLLRLAAAKADFIYLPEPYSRRACAPAPDRLSDIADAEYSRAFLENRLALFTPAARAAFGARILSWQLFRTGRKAEALRLVARAWQQRALPLADAVKIALRLSMPAAHAALVKWKQPAP